MFGKLGSLVGAGTNNNFARQINTLIANESSEPLQIVVTGSDDQVFSRTLQPRHGWKVKIRNQGLFKAEAFRRTSGGKWEDKPIQWCSDKAGYYAIFRKQGKHIEALTGQHVSTMGAVWQSYFKNYGDGDANLPAGCTACGEQHPVGKPCMVKCWRCGQQGHKKKACTKKV